MLELDNGHIYTYKANYSEFLNLKALRLEREEKAEKKLKRLLKMNLIGFIGALRLDVQNKNIVLNALMSYQKLNLVNVRALNLILYQNI